MSCSSISASLRPGFLHLTCPSQGRPAMHSEAISKCCSPGALGQRPALHLNWRLPGGQRGSWLWNGSDRKCLGLQEEGCLSALVKRGHRGVLKIIGGGGRGGQSRGNHLLVWSVHFNCFCSLIISLMTESEQVKLPPRLPHEDSLHLFTWLHERARVQEHLEGQPPLSLGLGLTEPPTQPQML